MSASFFRRVRADKAVRMKFVSKDDYPVIVTPLADAVGRGEIERSVVLCGSDVGAREELEARHFKPNTKRK